MNHSPGQIIARYTTAEGLTTLGDTGGLWPAFVGTLPDKPDDALSFSDTSGIIDGREHRGYRTVEHPGLQIFIRGLNYQTAFAKLSAILDKLDLVRNVPIVVEGTTYTIIAATRRGTILTLGEDANRRSRFTANVTVTFGE